MSQYVPTWMLIAQQELTRGVHEIPGPESNPRILVYHAATSFQATSDEVPWCSSFVNYCLQHAGYEGTRSAAARSWLTWGEPIDDPRYGAIVVLARGKNPAQGHVGFLTGHRESDDKILLLAGNQNDAVSIAAFDPPRVLAYRWPRGA